MIRVLGEEALELGLLFGTENLTPQEEETDVLCFPHLLIQELVGDYFLSKLDMVCLIYKINNNNNNSLFAGFVTTVKKKKELLLSPVVQLNTPGKGLSRGRVLFTLVMDNRTNCTNI